MVLQSFMLTGLWSTTGRLIIFLPCNGILFNHESERRGKTFVTRKISVAVANIMTGRQDKLTLVTLMLKGTGVMLPNLWRVCGECCRLMSLMILFWLPMRHIRYVNLSKRLSKCWERKSNGEEAA
jgi:hypothetical protein